MAKSDPTWQRVSCHPVFAVSLLASVFGAGWMVTSTTARELVCLLARVCG